MTGTGNKERLRLVRIASDSVAKEKDPPEGEAQQGFCGGDRDGS